MDTQTLALPGEAAWLAPLDGDARELLQTPPLCQMLAALTALLTPQVGGTAKALDVELTELDADPMGLQLLLPLLPEGLAQPAAIDMQGHCHLGADAVERLACNGQGLRAFYRFDLERLRAQWGDATRART